jgi:tetratricopeptide (TPR) repeat protein
MPDETLRLIFAGCENDGTINWELDRALDYARRVTIASPDFSMGWSGIAGIAVTLGPQKPPAEAAAMEMEAKRALDSALRLDPRNSEAWALKSYVLPASLFLQREDSLKRSIAARPLDCGCEHHAYGLFLSQVGRLRDAEREFQRGVDIMHLNEGLYANLARAQFANGNQSKALEALAAGKRVSRNPEDFDLLQAQFAIGAGDYAKASEILNSPDLANSRDARLLAQVADALHSRDGAAIARMRGAVMALTRNPETNRPLPISLLATLGDTNGALAAVQRLALKNPTAAYRILFDPALARAQRDAVFWDKAKTLGLTGYWQKSRQLPDLCTAEAAPPACASLQ